MTKSCDHKALVCKFGSICPCLVCCVGGCQYVTYGYPVGVDCLLPGWFVLALGFLHIAVDP